jgi:hypothetical protein
MTWHRSSPPELQDHIQLIVDRNATVVAEAIAGLRVDEPAFALCLWASDEPELYAAYISLGLESDRTKFLSSSTPWEAAVEIWISDGTYTYDGIEVRDPRGETAFLEAEARVNEWLEAAEVEEPSRWLMEEVAYRLSREPPPIRLTADFVAFVHDRGGNELISSLRWVVPAEKQGLLEQQGLLVDDIESLPGAPSEFEDS